MAMAVVNFKQMEECRVAYKAGGRCTQVDTGIHLTQKVQTERDRKLQGGGRVECNRRAFSNQ